MLGYFLEDLTRLALFARADEEAWRLRQEEHADEQDHGRYCSQAEHQAPVAGRGKNSVDDERGQNADHDHHLVERGDRAANLRGGDLGQVERHHQRRRSDAETDHEAGSQERSGARGRRRAEGADRERDGGDHDQPPACEPVRHGPTRTAPVVAPSSSAATTAPCMNGERPKSDVMNRIAPEMTPVS